jgi:uncharacterized protein YjiS (DUF1127 family)
MTAINPPVLSLRRNASTGPVSGRAPALSPSRAWTAVREWLAMRGRAERLPDLNDFLLRDIGLSRADLAHDALFWPIWRPRSARRD